MKTTLRICLLAVIAALTLLACKKEPQPEPEPEPEPDREIRFDAKVPWTYSEDAGIDHNLYYAVGDEFIYSRTFLPLEADAQKLAKFLKDNSLNIYNLADHSRSVKIYSADIPSEGEPEYEKETTLKLKKLTVVDGKLCANIQDFQWDKMYKIVIGYKFEENEVSATIYITTTDRNREQILLPMQEYTFTLNTFDEETGLGYIKSKGYYYWKSDPLAEVIKKAYETSGVTSQGDFESVELFGELELQGAVDEDEDDSIRKYVTFNTTCFYLETKTTFTKAVLTGSTFYSGEKDEDGVIFLGNENERILTSYIGECIVIPIKFNYRKN